MWKELLYPSLYRWGNYGTQRLHHLAKISRQTYFSDSANLSQESALTLVKTPVMVWSLCSYLLCHHFTSVCLLLFNSRKMSDFEIMDYFWESLSFAMFTHSALTDWELVLFLFFFSLSLFIAVWLYIFQALFSSFSCKLQVLFMLRKYFCAFPILLWDLMTRERDHEFWKNKQRWCDGHGKQATYIPITHLQRWCVGHRKQATHIPITHLQLALPSDILFLIHCTTTNRKH